MEQSKTWTIANILALVFVVTGLLNTMPNIPGLENLVYTALGSETFKIRQFTPEYYYPVAWFTMMTIVVLNHSMWRDWVGKTTARRLFGLCMDISLFLASLAISLTYIIELQSICLIDQITGDRAELIAQALKSEAETAKLLGLPVPTTVDDPNCIHTTGGWLIAIVGISIVIFLGYNIKVWGLPLVLVAMFITGYTFLTICIWYIYGADDINKYFITKLGGEPRSLLDGRMSVHDVLTNTQTGFMGRFIHIILNTVFPYIILGTLFGVSAGGKSLIKTAFNLTRNLRGGPAHAAIVSSATFGTISGGPVVNVLSTGVLTIPMMIKRGFSKVFAGGVEAAASTGGSIMPPVMGIAALVLASITGIPYSDVIVAAIIPAIAYFVCLFLTVSFQARKQHIQAYGKLTPDMILTGQEKINLLMIFVPLMVILVILLTPKQDVGCGFISGLLGTERLITDGKCTVQSMPWLVQLMQNSAGSAKNAGWWAVMTLVILLFLDPEMRKRPLRLVHALMQGGRQISKLFLMFLAVTIIDFCLQFTGLPTFISLDVIKGLQGFNLGADSNIIFQLFALFVTMVMAILLGLGMPAVPAYLNVALLMGPILVGLGISVFTAHMFIFYFAVASSITPPVALASFAAASITHQCPMKTGFSGLRSGIVMFVIPFVFALYPEILLVEQAQLNPIPNTGKYLMGYDGTLDWQIVIFLIVRLCLILYLLSSALVRFDTYALSIHNSILRIILCILILFKSPIVYIPAVVGGVGIILYTHMRRKSIEQKATL